MNELIELVKQWGVDKGITGENGKANLLSQAKKMREEATETFDAATDCYLESQDGEAPYWETLHNLKDGIGDTVVTLILLCELAGVRLEECLEQAYDEIKGRTGQMVGGQFVKDK